MMKAAPAAVKLWQGGRQENGKRPQAYLSSTRWSTSMRTQRQGGRHHLDQRARHQRGRLEPDTWPDKIATASLAYNTASLNASELLSQLRSTHDEVYTTALSRQVHRAQAVVLKGRAAELPTPLSVLDAHAREELRELTTSTRDLARLFIHPRKTCFFCRTASS